jgi:hypothetical protein
MGAVRPIGFNGGAAVWTRRRAACATVWAKGKLAGHQLSALPAGAHQRLAHDEVEYESDGVRNEKRQ